MKSAQRQSVRAACAFVFLAWCASAAAQTPAKWTQGKTPDGQPDLQGTWLNFDATPFETPVARSAPAPAAAGSTAATNVGPASEFADHNHQVSARRRSMVVDPPDGRVPVMKWAEDKRDFDLEHIPDAPGARNALGAVHHARPPRRHVPRRLQQRLPDHADPGLRGVRLRDDPRDAHRSDRRPAGAGRGHPAVERRAARPLGRQHAGGREHELQQQGIDRQQRGHRPHPRHPAERVDEGHRAVHARGREDHRLHA